MVEVAAVAGMVLSRHFDLPVRVESVSPFETSEYKGDVTVARLVLSGAPVETAICKYGSDRDTLANEAAGLRFLSPLSPDVVPAWYGSDADGSLIAFEDFGTGPSLADLLKGGTPNAAITGLEGRVDALLAVHRPTFGRSAEFASARTSRPAFTTGRLGDEIWPELQPYVSEVAPEIAGPALSHALWWIDSVLQPVGPWHAFSLGDVCPDNNVVLPDGRVRLFDVEFCEFRHALLDLAYVRTVMPTCWCVRRLPSDLSDRLVARYRAGLDSDAGFDEGLAAAQAYWALWDLNRWLDQALHDPDSDRMRYVTRVDFALPSQRQSVELRLAELASAAALHRELAPLGDLAAALAERLRTRWAPFDPLPLYPAFAGPRQIPAYE